MLHTESITGGTLETLKQLMRDETLQDMLAHLGQVYEDFPFT